MLCCRCNRTGQCRGCACVKAGQPCSNCLPSRLGSCSNESHRQDPAQSVTSIPTPTSTPTPSGRSPTHADLVQVVVSGSDVVSIPETPVHNQLNSISCTPLDNEPTCSSPPVPSLPPLTQLATSNFVWGEVDSASFCKSLREVYDEVIQWRMNCFKVPLGIAGRSFVAELARLYRAFANGSAMESIALMATTVLPILALQLPHKRSKVKEHIKYLERRLKTWSDGDLTTLVKEGRTIQPRLPKTSRVNVESESRLARTFANLMFRGKTHAALDLLANSGKGGVLHLDQPANADDPDSVSVREVLVSKHPTGQPASPESTESTLWGLPPVIHPIIFDSIDARLIRSTALKTSGAAGPSGLDAHAWWRLCTAFKSASTSFVPVTC